MTKQPALTFKAPIETSTFIDQNVNPGDDFYRYACGKWIASNPLPDTEARWGSFSILRKQALENIKTLCDELLNKEDTALSQSELRIKHYYKAALEIDTHKKASRKILVDELKAIDSINTTDDMLRTFGRMQRINVGAPWRVYVDADEKDSTTYVLRLTQSGLTLPEKDYYTSSDKAIVKARKELSVHMRRLHEIMPEVAESVEKLDKAVTNIEKQLADVSRTSVQLRDVEACYNPFSLSELTGRFPKVNWGLYFEALNWEPKGRVVVNQPEFLDAVMNSLETQIEDWKIYLKWHVLISFLNTISVGHAKLNFEFFGKILGGQKEIKPLWRRALMTADSILGEDLGQIYVKKYFPESSKKEMEVIAHAVRSAYGNRIKKIAWMSESTKQRALTKLNNIQLMIGYPDSWRDYSNFLLNDLHICNVMKGYECELTYELSKLGTKVKRNEWAMTPHTVNAYCDFNLVNNVFPAGILQSPFYDAHASLGANYGGIGAVIGHELTHAFDDKGSQFDENGILNPWIVGSEKEEFEKRTQIIIDCASKHEVLPGLYMKGDLVVGEAIADLGGAEIALQALVETLQAREVSKEESTKEIQQFFIFNALTSCSVSSDELRRELAIGDPHPDDQYRVNGIIAHMDAFYEAYDVKDADKLHIAPNKRARIW